MKCVIFRIRCIHLPFKFSGLIANGAILRNIAVMPQKSILSFFSSNSKEEPTEDLNKVIAAVTSKSKRKRVIVESDDSFSDDKSGVENQAPEDLLKMAVKPQVSDAVYFNVNSGLSNNFSGKAISSDDVQTQETTHINSTGESVKDADEISSTPVFESVDGMIPQGSAGLSYNPSKPNYHPVNDCNWSRDQSVPYLSLAKTFEYIEATSGRIKITEALCNFFRSVGFLSPDDLTTCIYLCLNRLGPAYEGHELGVGESLLLKAIGATTGVSLEHLRATMKRQGDLGSVAESIRSRQKTMFTPKPLTVSVVFSKLKEIAMMSGNAAQSKKVERIRSLLVACRESEAKYLIRSLSGKLRIGLAEQTVLSALGQAVAMTPFHSASAIEGDTSRILNASEGLSADQWKFVLETSIAGVKRAYCVCPNYDRLVQGLLTDDPNNLHLHCFITPGIPLKPMLAHPTHGVMDVLKRFDESDFTCEYKYDGERAQIHVLDSGQINIYSRNQEDNTSKYPDIVNNLMPRIITDSKLRPETIELLKTYGKGGNLTDKYEIALRSCILDSEVVAWDRQAGHILPFQILSTRKRKDVDESAVKVQVCVYVFDILYVNGFSLIECPFRFRRDILRNVFPQIHGEFMMATSLDSSDTEEIGCFLEEAIKGNCEGLMVKTLDHLSTYEIAKRSHNWLKLKKDYLDGVGDTLDLVVIGGFQGTGKRAGRYGGYLLACYDPEAEEYQTICKIGTGMKDDELASFSNFFKDFVIDRARPYYQYTSGLVPDQWFEPVQVWEIKAADLSISPAHKAAAGLADSQKGISLRFPRFIRVRDDKKPEDATTSQQVYELYKSQEQIKNQTTSADLNEDDLY